MITYGVIIKIGSYEFVKSFLDEQAALDCFDSLAENQSGEITNGTLTVQSNALVDIVTIRRYNDEIERFTEYERFAGSGELP